MKCIACGNDSKYRERADHLCPKCRHEFAFEPRTGDKLSDAAFAGAIERVSSGGTVRFTERNLYYEVLRRGRKVRVAGPLLVALAIIAILLMFLGVQVHPFFVVLSLVAVIVLVVAMPRSKAAFPYATFAPMLQRWRRVHGAPKGLIVRRQGPPVPRELPTDIQHYSFDRAVVTDSRDTADVLLANNFHFENNCAVLTFDGYPEEAFPVVKRMLKNNPKLSVYVLHDATVLGQGLAHHLATNDFFQKTARIVDVGLGPEHARIFKGLWQEAPYGAGGKGWLASYYLELAVVRPEQIIKRLFRALANQAPLTLDPTGTFFIDGTAFSSEASASDGGGDSFG